MRYAIYLAPEPQSALWRFGSRVIGRDAASDEPIAGFAPEGFNAYAWRALTDEPRRYGFHATLKAPFRLKPNVTSESLRDAAMTQAATQAPFSLGRLEVTVIKVGGSRGFIALRPKTVNAELARLEATTLEALEPFRAPLTAAEIARRQPERLTLRQGDYLQRYGYPYVLDEFRFHFTLTNAIAHPEPVAERLAEAYAREAGEPFTIDALTLFHQRDAGGDFRLVDRFPFGAAP